MPPKRTVGKTPAPTDDRFKRIQSDPRFKNIHIKPRKAKVDDRFKSMLEDDDFKQTTVDKYNRKRDITDTALQSLYSNDDSDADDSEEEQDVLNDESSDANNVNELSGDEQSTDIALSDDDNDDDREEESSTDIDISEDYEDIEDEDEEIPEGHVPSNIKGDYAPIVENASHRLAMYNMEWEQLKAVDLLAVMRSFCPPGGKIHSVSVYPSEYGKQMIERERQGDYTLWTSDQIDKAAREAQAKKVEELERRQAKKQVQEQQGKKNTPATKQQEKQKPGAKGGKAKQAPAGKGNNNKNNKKTKGAPVSMLDEESSSDLPLDEDDDDNDDDDEDALMISDEEIDRMVFGENEDDQQLLLKQQERLKEYEMGKLRYYYAILDCDSVDTAVHIYQEADGVEYESSSNVFDLRFVPDDHIFDENTLRDRATHVPHNHRPPVYTTNCLQSSNIECTWEREDPNRARLLRQAFDQNEYKVDDLAAFLDEASDDENFHTDVPVSETDSGDVDSDSDSDSNSDADEDEDEDDDSNSDLDGLDEKYARAQRNRRKGLGDAIDADIIHGVKVEKGKRKKIYSLKRRARNEFSSILSQLKGGETSEERQKRKDKARVLSKAAKNLDKDDDDNDDSEEEESSSESDFGIKQTPFQKQKKTIVFESALDTFATGILEKQANKAEEVRQSRLTLWQRQLEKMKEKKKEAKQRAKEKKREAQIDSTARRPKVVEKDSIYDDDDVTVDYNDPFFQDVFDEAEFGKVDLQSSSGKSNADDDSDSDDENDPEQPRRPSAKQTKDDLKQQKKLERARLALLMDDNQTRNDGDSSDDENKGYNLQELVKKNKLKQLAAQTKRKRAKDYEDELISSSLGLKADSITEKDIQRAAKENKIQLAKKQRRKGRNASDDDEDDAIGVDNDVNAVVNLSEAEGFAINTKDDRFTAIFDDPEFGIDPTSALFHETEGVTELLKESQRIRRQKTRQREEAIKKRKRG